MLKGRSGSKETSPRSGKAEKHVTGKTMEIWSADREKLIHELQVHQAELEMQNEELRRTRAELEESWSRYVDLYDFAPVGYLTFDETGAVKDANITAAWLLGIERSFLKDKPFLLFLDSPESRDLFYRHIRHVHMTGGKQTCEVAARGRGDTPFYAQLESIAAEVEGNRVIRTILTDISDRKHAEEELRASHERFRILSEATFEGIALTEGGTILEVNDQLVEITGYGKDELIGSNVASFIFPDDRARVMTNIRDGREMVMEHRAVRKDGAVITVETHGKPFTYMGRSIRMTTIRDISERKAAETAVREIQERLSIAAEAARLGIYDRDLIADTGRWDQRTEDLWGVKPDEPITYGTVVSGILPEDRPRMQKELDKALNPAGDGKYYAEYRVVSRRDGVTRWIAATGQVFFDHGRASRLVGTVQDITGRKQAEEEARLAMETFARTFRGNAAAMALSGEDGRILDVNDRWMQLTGFRREEAVGKTTTELRLWKNPEDRAALIREIGQAGGSRGIEATCLHRSGREWTALFFRPARHHPGQTSARHLRGGYHGAQAGRKGPSKGA